MGLQRTAPARPASYRFMQSVASLPTAGPERGLARQLFGGSGEPTLALLRAAWLSAVGPELARRTEVIALEAGTLRVRVPDAGWRKTLHAMRRELLSRLWAVAGDLAPRRLGFMEAAPAAVAASLRAARTSAPASPRSDIAMDAPRGPVPPALRDAAQAIADPELRERFLACALGYLSRNRSS